MRYRQLGDSGLTVSLVGIGCNNFGRPMDGNEVAAVVDAALEAGITLFDTSDSYGGRPGESEELLGAALKGRRDDAVIATKFGWDMRGANGADWGVRGSRRYVRRAVEASLRRLGTDWIDLYQYHRPDGITPIEETLDVLDDLVRDGLVRYIGHSNFAAWQLADADWAARDRGRTRFVSAQNRYSLLERQAEKELLPACARFGVGVLPYFPLANGLLTGKYRRGATAPAGSRLAVRRQDLLESAPWDALEALANYANERGVTMLDVAIGALAARPAVSSVIAGATRPDQVRANAATLHWQPTAEDLTVLDGILPPPT
jgi:aryl-alcohol dehydrogenase-like predicted oxidoreductase